MFIYALLYISLILVCSVAWAGSLLEYRIAKHNISLSSVKSFLNDLGFPLNQYFSLSSRFNYWKNRGLEPSEYLQNLDLSNSLTTARVFGGIVMLGFVILIRDLTFGFSWNTIFWLALSIGTLLYLRPWRFGMKLLDIEATLESKKSTNS
jgi:hypothetical protein